MRPEPTYCEDCAHVFKPQRDAPPWRWMCVKHPRLEGFGFVTRRAWDDLPPYLYCKDVNGGCCRLFEAAASVRKKMEIVK